MGISAPALVGVLVSCIASRRATLSPPLPRWVTSSPAVGLESTMQIWRPLDTGFAFERLDSIRDIIRKIAAITERLIRRSATQRPAMRAALLVSAAAAVKRGDGTAIPRIWKGLPETRGFIGVTAQGTDFFNDMQDFNTLAPQATTRTFARAAMSAVSAGISTARLARLDDWSACWLLYRRSATITALRKTDGEIIANPDGMENKFSNE